jgi:hypothetical protein
MRRSAPTCLGVGDNDPIEARVLVGADKRSGRHITSAKRPSSTRPDGSVLCSLSATRQRRSFVLSFLEHADARAA